MRIIVTAAFVGILAACTGNTEFQKASDPQEAAREFIRSSLDGNYDKARFYLYKDSLRVNEMLLNKWKTVYDGKSAEDKVSQTNSNIIVVRTEEVNDSTEHFVYYNSFRPDTTTLKVIRVNGEWLVDLQDTFTKQ